MTNNIGSTSTAIWEFWLEMLPRRPFCTDDFINGVYRQPFAAALEFDYIEFNSAGRVCWLIFDCDRYDFEPWEHANMPPPNIFTSNRANGHSHLAYALKTPVGLSGESRSAPIQLLADVQRGMIRRLGADKAYANRLSKNPVSKRWASSFHAPFAYSLTDLLGWLDRADIRRSEVVDEAIGYSRNCDLFNRLRRYSYDHVKAAREISTFPEWQAKMIKVALSLNHYAIPLPASEIRAIARSVAKWTWQKLSTGRGSTAIREQAYRRGMFGHLVRYSDRETLDDLRPWEAFGYSRATWYRHGRPTPNVPPRDPTVS